MLYQDEDYVYCKRFDHSLTKLLERHPDGAPDSLIASVLLIEEHEVEANYDMVVAKLRGLLDLDRDE